MELHCLQVHGPITEEAEKWGVCNRAVHGVLVDKEMKYEARINIIILHLHIMISWNGRFSSFNSVAASIRKLWIIK